MTSPRYPFATSVDAEMNKRIERLEADGYNKGEIIRAGVMAFEADGKPVDLPKSS